MRYRIFDLAWSAESGTFDFRALDELVEASEVLRVSERLVRIDRCPHLLVTLQYRERWPTPDERAGDEAAGAKGAGRTRAPWEEVLDPSRRGLFETLRSWRRERAREDAVPAYVILTNVQLAHISNAAPQTIASLQEVPGLGKARAARYGEEVVAIVVGVARRSVVEPTDADTTRDDEPTTETTGDDVTLPDEAAAADAEASS